MTKALCIITIEDSIVKKKFKKTSMGSSRFFSELFNYFHVSRFKLDFIPKIIDWNVEELWFTLENVGQSLNKIYYRKSKRHLNYIIRELHEQFYEKTSYYHNDIRYKNVCLKDGKYFLIDLERSDFSFKDKNDDKILNESACNQYECKKVGKV